MKKIVTFGELMMRLSPPGVQRIEQSQTLERYFGGAEANVAVSLAKFGMHSLYITCLPDNPIGDAALAELHRHGVDVSRILRGGERMGLYYAEGGASQRPSKVIYDRAGSAFTSIRKEVLNWPDILRDADWFHVTGITPALSPELAGMTFEAMRVARENDVPVSLDINYRKKLWNIDTARRTLDVLMRESNIAIVNEEDAQLVFDIQSSADVRSGRLNQDEYIGIAAQLMAMYPGLRYVCISMRESISASENNWSALIWDGSTAYISRTYHINIVDRIGSGDAFAAGVIYCLIMDVPLQETIEYAVAASALKHSVHGDFNLVSIDEVQALMEGDGSGRVQR